MSLHVGFDLLSIQMGTFIPRKQSCVLDYFFIISHQLSLGSDLCDLEFGCRTDFIFNPKDVDSEGTEPDRDGLWCCVALEKSLCLSYFVCLVTARWVKSNSTNVNLNPIFTVSDRDSLLLLHLLLLLSSQ